MKQTNPPPEKRAAMHWAKRLKRVFNIDITSCDQCGADVRIVASIEAPVVIRKILAHLDDKTTTPAKDLLPECRAPPQAGPKQPAIQRWQRMWLKIYIRAT